MFIFREEEKNQSRSLSTASSNFCSILSTFLHIIDISRKYTQSWESVLYSVKKGSYTVKVEQQKIWTFYTVLSRPGNIILQNAGYSIIYLL